MSTELNPNIAENSEIGPDSGLSQSRFLRACRCESVDCTPVWLMRQAGRYMSEYREIRKRHSMLEVIGSPDLAAEITLQPINAFDLDAAIIFSDILPPLIEMGISLDFVKGEGPKIDNPIRSVADVESLQVASPQGLMESTLKAIEIVSSELNPRGIPLIGFAGAPFTLACYAIQGEGSKAYELAKQFMYTHPQAWDSLMNKVVAVVANYLLEQVKHGASAIQVFDSWAGVLSRSDFIRYVQPYNVMLCKRIEAGGVPTIYFSTGTTAHLSDVAVCGSDVLGVDWRVDLSQAQKKISVQSQKRIALQGNLDPAALLAPWDELKQQIDAVLDKAKQLDGHVFNLGHGIYPATPVENVARMVDYVHEQTTNQS